MRCRSPDSYGILEKPKFSLRKGKVKQLSYEIGLLSQAGVVFLLELLVPEAP